MRGDTTRVVKTLRVRVVPEGTPLVTVLEFLRHYTSWLQFVIDKLWGRKNVPSLATLHNEFYDFLRSKNFRAHHVKELLKLAKEIVKATKKNGGSKPIIKSLFARLDRYDTKVDLERGVVRIALWGRKYVTLRMLHRRSYLARFRGWSYYNLVLKWDSRERNLYACIMFRRDVEMKKISGFLALDINFDNVAVVIEKNQRIVAMKLFPMPLRKALTHKIWAERIQKRYPKIWRFSKNILNAIRKHHRRAHEILTQHLHRLANRIVDLAEKYRVAIVMEELTGLKNNCRRSRAFNTKLSMFAYRRLQEYIRYKALERGIPVIVRPARGTSSKCPVCGGRLSYIGGKFRLVVCKCGYVGHRDITACLNLLGFQPRKMCPRAGRGRTGSNPMKPRGDVTQPNEAMTMQS